MKYLIITTTVIGLVLNCESNYKETLLSQPNPEFSLSTFVGERLSNFSSGTISVDFSLLCQTLEPFVGAEEFSGNNELPFQVCPLFVLSVDTIKFVSGQENITFANIIVLNEESFGGCDVDETTLLQRHSFNDSLSIASDILHIGPNYLALFGFEEEMTSCVKGSKINITVIELDCWHNGTICSDHGKCDGSSFAYNCKCSDNWKGKYCEEPRHNGTIDNCIFSDENSCAVRIDHCLQRNCSKAGTLRCVNGSDGYQCICQSGFEGDLCDKDIDECSKNLCKNHINCTNLFPGYKCICLPGFVGKDCEIELDECLSNPCSNHSACVDEVNGYACYCENGYEGERCNREVDECLSSPCLHGSECEDLVGQYKCVCSVGYSGNNCETNIDECLSDPCKNGGRCNDLVNGYSCSCLPGFASYDCGIEVDECQSHPCLNNGTCYNLVAKFYCACPHPYQGKQCELLPCNDPNICYNKGTCLNVLSNSTWENSTDPGFRCECAPGFEGLQCSVNIQECNSSPCGRGHCIDGVNTFQCLCPPGIGGRFCDQPIKYCDQNECENNGTCINHDPIGYKCNCTLGWEGEFCEREVDECETFKPCKNNGTCVDMFNDYYCVCPAGLEGKNCSSNINECQSNPCLNGGSCFDLVNNYTCTCPPLFNGNHCETPFNPCDLDNGSCKNSGVCKISERGSPFCECSRGYTGPYCEANIDECLSNPCQNGAHCWDGIGGYLCRCTPGFKGENCETVRDTCDDIYCFNGGTCTKTDEKAICLCKKGFSGDDCSLDVDECVEDPHCINGATCANTQGSYFCYCNNGYAGKNCESDLDECSSNPCSNNGTCKNLVGLYVCQCLTGFNGINCEQNHDDCNDVFCYNNGTCIDQVSDYFCKCTSGWTGKLCQVKVDNCQSNPCENAGSCMSKVNDFYCLCREGFTGERCEFDLENCKDFDANKSLCMNDGICTETSFAVYKCVCPNGFTGPFCETDENECQSQPCQNNSTCIDMPGKYECNCAVGFSGRFCEIQLDSCWSEPCKNEGICLQALQSFKCFCKPGYHGETCSKVKDMCWSKPCLNNAKCTSDSISYHCNCTDGFEGLQCEEHIIKEKGAIAISSSPHFLANQTLPFENTTAKNDSNMKNFLGSTFNISKQSPVNDISVEFKQESSLSDNSFLNHTEPALNQGSDKVETIIFQDLEHISFENLMNSTMNFHNISVNTTTPQPTLENLNTKKRPPIVDFETANVSDPTDLEGVKEPTHQNESKGHIKGEAVNKTTTQDKYNNSLEKIIDDKMKITGEGGSIKKGVINQLVNNIVVNFKNASVTSLAKAEDENISSAQQGTPTTHRPQEYDENVAGYQSNITQSIDYSNDMSINLLATETVVENSTFNLMKEQNPDDKEATQINTSLKNQTIHAMRFNSVNTVAEDSLMPVQEHVENSSEIWKNRTQDIIDLHVTAENESLSKEPFGSIAENEITPEDPNFNSQLQNTTNSAFLSFNGSPDFQSKQPNSDRNLSISKVSHDSEEQKQAMLFNLQVGGKISNNGSRDMFNSSTHISKVSESNASATFENETYMTTEPYHSRGNSSKAVVKPGNSSTSKNPLLLYPTPLLFPTPVPHDADQYSASPSPNILAVPSSSLIPDLVYSSIFKSLPSKKASVSSTEDLKISISIQKPLIPSSVATTATSSVTSSSLNISAAQPNLDVSEETKEIEHKTNSLSDNIPSSPPHIHGNSPGGNTPASISLSDSGDKGNNSTCHHGATSVNTEQGTICICPFGWSGSTCNLTDNKINATSAFSFDGDRFNETSYLEYQSISGIEDSLEINIRFTWPHKNCLLLYIGDPKLTRSDFLEIGLERNFVSFRFDVGNRPEELKLEYFNQTSSICSVTVKRAKYFASLSLNNKSTVVENLRSKRLKQLNIPISGRIYVGGFKNQQPQVQPQNTTTKTHSFTGCIFNLDLKVPKRPQHCSKNKEIPEEKLIPLFQDATPTSGKGVRPCDPKYLCSNNPCLHGSRCIVSDTGFKCMCSHPWKGVYCDVEVQSCNKITCLNGGSCIILQTKEASCLCLLGWTGRFCEKALDISDPRFNGTMHSWMRFPPLNIRRETDIIIQFKTTSDNGLLFYVAEESQRYNCDFLSVTLDNGFAELRYSLGPNSKSAIRYPFALTHGIWYKLQTGRLRNEGYIQLSEPDNLMINTINSVKIQSRSDSEMTSLDTRSDFYLGGHPYLSHIVDSAIHGEKIGFSGCIRQFIVNGFSYDINYYHNRLPGNNLQTLGAGITDCDNDHCGFQTCQNAGDCVESYNRSTCQCVEGWKGQHCEHHASCIPPRSLCGNSTCFPSFKFAMPKCYCRWRWYGKRCNKRYVQLDDSSAIKFSGTSYAKIQLPSESENASSTVFSFFFKTWIKEGLVLWVGNSLSSDMDHLSIGLQKGKLMISLQLGYSFDHKEVNVSNMFISDNNWHHVMIRRDGKHAKVYVDQFLSLTLQMKVSFFQFNNVDFMYVGGFGHDKEIHKATFGLYKLPFIGCLRELNWNLNNISWSAATPAENLQLCT